MGISVELAQKVENAILDNRLVGNTFFSDDEYEALLGAVRQFSSYYVYSGGYSINNANERLIFVTLVEIAKRWKKIDDDENEESGFWEFVFKTVLETEGNNQNYTNRLQTP